MSKHKTIMVEARRFVCPRESCQHEWLCYKWRDYVQCPLCHANITLNPKRQPRATYHNKKVEGQAHKSSPLPHKTGGDTTHQASTTQEQPREVFTFE